MVREGAGGHDQAAGLGDMVGALGAIYKVRRTIGQIEIERKEVTK